MKTISADRIRHDLFHLCRDPLPYRKANWTRPGQTMHSLDETDVFIRSQLEAAGCLVNTTTHRVQAFRCDETKPVHHWYSKPKPGDPWFDVANLEVILAGSEYPKEIIQLISHKDSMSWIDSPGAHDNATGTVANMDLARVLATRSLRRTVRILFCNEEHTPWTSQHAANTAAERGDEIIAVLNVDSLDGKSDTDMARGRLSHVVTYSTAEGQRLADLIANIGAREKTGLEVSVSHKERVNDDDGMFIKAGYGRTVMNVGSFPYADTEYHLPGDVPERVNVENVALSAQLILTAVLEIDAKGVSSFDPT